MTDQRDTDQEAEWLEQAAASFDPAARSNKPSALRTYLRDHYDAVLKVKQDRGLSWPQVAALLSERGLTKTDGSPLDGNAVAVMAAQVRWERAPRSRKRRPPMSAKVRKAPQAPAAPPAAELPTPDAPPPAAEPVPVAPPPDPQPAAIGVKPANPYAELERRQAEEKTRRERAASARDWNPFDLSNKEGRE